MGGGLKETEEGQKNSNKKSKNDFQVCIGKLIIISRWQKKAEIQTQQNGKINQSVTQRWIIICDVTK